MRIFLVFLVFLLAVTFFHDFLIGMTLDPLLEKELSILFDMPVNIEGMRVHLWPGHVSVKKIEFLNPPGFKRRDHFTARQIDIYLDLSVIDHKFIRIKRAHFKEVIFAIESYMTPEGSRTNVKHWYHHMGLDEDDPPLPPRPLPPSDNAGEDTWRVRIDRLELEKGAVIFDDRRVSPVRHWVFQNLKGYWEGFDFISKYTSPVFTEYIKLEGTFGENPAARFSGEGKCQFADGDNFDIKAQILGGSVMEYDFLMEGLPAEVRKGTFDLRSEMLCIESNLDSEHQLTLKSLEFAAPTATQKFLKYPFNTALFLLENQKTVELDMRVDGYIGDPKFRFASAFTKALQKALIYKAKASLKELQKGTVKIAIETPDQVKNGLGKVTAFMTDALPAKNLLGENKNGKKS